MLLDIATVLTTIFTYVDDSCKTNGKVKPGPEPKMTDSEIITIAIFCELSGKSSEYAHVRHVNQWLREFFPHMIDRSRYHRRVKSLTPTINYVRLEILPQIVESLSVCITDSTPVPIITFQRACFTPLFQEAEFGRCAARKMTYYGFKLHLVTDSEGIPIHFDITPANQSDVSMIEEILSEFRNCSVLADKGYISQEISEKLLMNQNVDLWYPKRRNQKDRESKSERKYLSKLRQKIETVNGMLKDQFSLERTLAKTLYGLVSRIIRKITAFTFGILLNRLFGRDLMNLVSVIN